MDDIDKKIAALKQEPMTSYTFSVGPTLHEQLDKHVYAIKNLKDPNMNKQRWTYEAIKEKLDQVEGSDEIAKEFRLSVKVDSETFDRLDRLVEKTKKTRKGSYSKKQLILEAIYDKLHSEKKIIKQKLAELN